MSKWGKTLLGLAAVGGAVAAGALYLSKKNKCENCDDCEADFEDEDFDLDSDLKPTADRGYVSLTPANAAEETEAEVAEETTEEAEVAEEVTEEATEEAAEAVEETTEE